MYDELLAKIEDILKTALPADENADWAQSVFLTENTNHSQLTSSCCDLLLRGGKRWRPLLAALICESFGGGQAVLPLSPLIEFCHNASLIHDDIEDNSDLRRGKPAIHKIYGNDTAINSGSFLYFLPLVCVDSWSAPDSFKLRLYQLWAANMRRLHLGQSMDIAWHRDRDFFPVVEQYFQMCALKTGVLAKMAVLTGALAAETAGADTKITMRTQILADAAEKIGAAFQILDDVKNLTAEIAGKTACDDLVEGKKSLPLILFVNERGIDASEKQKRHSFVLECMDAAATGGASVPNVNALIKQLEISGSLDMAKKIGNDMLATGKHIFVEENVIFEDFFSVMLLS